MRPSPLNPAIATVATRATQFAGNRRQTLAPLRTIGRTSRMASRLRRLMVSRSRSHLRLATFLDRIQNRFTGPRDGFPFFRSMDMVLARLRRVMTLAATVPAESIDPWPRRRISAPEPVRSASLPPPSLRSETGPARAGAKSSVSDARRATARPPHPAASPLPGAMVRLLVLREFDLAPWPQTGSPSRPSESTRRSEISAPASALARLIRPEQPVLHQAQTVVQRIVQRQFVDRVIYRSAVSLSRSPHPPVRGTRKGATSVPVRIASARQASVIRLITTTQLRPLPSLPTATRIGAKRAVDGTVRWLSGWLKPPATDQDRRQASALALYQTAIRTSPQTLSRPPVPIVSWLGVAPPVPSLPLLPGPGSSPPTSESLSQMGNRFGPAFSRLPALDEYRQAIPVSTPGFSRGLWSDAHTAVFILPLYRRVRRDVTPVMEEVTDATRFFPPRSLPQATPVRRTAAGPGGAPDSGSRPPMVSPLLTRLEPPQARIQTRVSPLHLQSVSPRPAPEPSSRKAELPAERPTPLVRESIGRAAGRRAARQPQSSLPTSETDAEDAQRYPILRVFTIIAPAIDPSRARSHPVRALLRRIILESVPRALPQTDVTLLRLMYPSLNPRPRPGIFPVLESDSLKERNAMGGGAASPGTIPPASVWLPAVRLWEDPARLVLPQARRYARETDTDSLAEGATVSRLPASVFQRRIPPLMVSRLPVSPEPTTGQQVVISSRMTRATDTPGRNRGEAFRLSAISTPYVEAATQGRAIAQEGQPFTASFGESQVLIPISGALGMSGRGASDSIWLPSINYRSPALPRLRSRGFRPTLPDEESGWDTFAAVENDRPMASPSGPISRVGMPRPPVIGVIARHTPPTPAFLPDANRIALSTGSTPQYRGPGTIPAGSLPVRGDAPVRRRIAVFTPLVIHRSVNHIVPTETSRRALPRSFRRNLGPAILAETGLSEGEGRIPRLIVPQRRGVPTQEMDGRSRRSTIDLPYRNSSPSPQLSGYPGNSLIPIAVSRFLDRWAGGPSAPVEMPRWEAVVSRTLFLARALPRIGIVEQNIERFDTPPAYAGAASPPGRVPVRPEKGYSTPAPFPVAASTAPARPSAIGIPTGIHVRTPSHRQEVGSRLPEYLLAIASHEIRETMPADTIYYRQLWSPRIFIQGRKRDNRPQPDLKVAAEAVQYAGLARENGNLARYRALALRLSPAPDVTPETPTHPPIRRNVARLFARETASPIPPVTQQLSLVPPISPIATARRVMRRLTRDSRHPLTTVVDRIRQERQEEREPREPGPLLLRVARYDIPSGLGRTIPRLLLDAPSVGMTPWIPALPPALVHRRTIPGNAPIAESPVVRQSTLWRYAEGQERGEDAGPNGVQRASDTPAVPFSLQTAVRLLSRQPDPSNTGRILRLFDEVDAPVNTLARFRTRIPRGVPPPDTAIEMPGAVSSILPRRNAGNPYSDVAGNGMVSPVAYPRQFVPLRRRIPALPILRIGESDRALNPLAALLAFADRHEDASPAHRSPASVPNFWNRFQNPVMPVLPMRSNFRAVPREEESEAFAQEASTLAFVRLVGRALGDLLKWSTPTRQTDARTAYAESQRAIPSVSRTREFPAAGTLLQRIGRPPSDPLSHLPQAVSEREIPAVQSLPSPPSPVLLKTVTLAEARRNRRPGTSPALLQPAVLGTSFEGDSGDTVPDTPQGATSSTERDEAAGVDLLAQEVWRLLKRRLATEKERGYRRSGRP